MDRKKWGMEKEKKEEKGSIVSSGIEDKMVCLGRME